MEDHKIAQQFQINLQLADQIEKKIVHKSKNIKKRKIVKQQETPVQKYCPNESEEGNKTILCQDCNPKHLENYYHQFKQPTECLDGVLCTNFFYGKCPYSHNVDEITKEGCMFGFRCRNYSCSRRHPPGTHRLCKDGAECSKVKIGVNYDSKHVEEFLHPPECMSHKNTPCKYGANCTDKTCDFLHVTKSFNPEDEETEKYVHITNSEGKDIYVKVSDIFTVNKKL